MNDWVLYMHKSKINGKVYIGITSNIKLRWRGTGSQYKPHNGKNQNIPFWNAIKKYGFDSFEHIILKENLSYEDACKLEIEYISKYDSTNKEKGYNRAVGGNGGLIYAEHPRGMKGKRQTENQKTSHRKWALKKENNCMTNGTVKWGVTHEHPKGMSGKHHTEEHKKKVSEFMNTQHPNFKPCYLCYPDGRKIPFKSPKFLCEYIGIKRTTTIYRTMVKTPYEIKPHNTSKTKRYDLVGLWIEFEEKDN